MLSCRLTPRREMALCSNEGRSNLRLSDPKSSIACTACSALVQRWLGIPPVDDTHIHEGLNCSDY
jgi:hypothetical protein